MIASPILVTKKPYKELTGGQFERLVSCWDGQVRIDIFILLRVFGCQGAQFQKFSILRERERSMSGEGERAVALASKSDAAARRSRLVSF